MGSKDVFVTPARAGAGPPDLVPALMGTACDQTDGRVGILYRYFCYLSVCPPC